jgi:YVTN family beta-propeller protein
MGIFSPSSFLSFSGITGLSGFQPASAACASNGQMIVKLSNSLGYQVSINSINVTTSSGVSVTQPESATLNPGQTQEFIVFGICPKTSGSSFSDTITVAYTEPSQPIPGPYSLSGTAKGTSTTPTYNTFTAYNLPGNVPWTVEYAGMNQTTSASSMTFVSLSNSAWQIYPVTVNGVTYYPIYAAGNNISAGYNLEVDFIPMRNLWVTNYFLGVSMIYYNNNTLAKNSTGGVLLDTPSYARDIVETLNGNYVYISNTGTNNLTRVSVSNYAITNEINLNNPSLGLAITPNGKFIYIAGASPYVLVFSIATGSLIATIPLPANGYAAEVAITPNGKYVYVGDNSGGLVVISTATNSVVDVIPPSEVDAWGVAVSPNGQFVYAADDGGSLNDNVSVISTATNSVVARIPIVIGNTKNLAITPNGQYVYVTGQSPEVSVISTATNAVISTINLSNPLTPSPDAEGLSITPNGQYVYTANFGTNGNRSVSVISTATNSVVDVITGFPDINLGPCSVNYGPLGSSC